jgi:hypothetical protein
MQRSTQKDSYKIYFLFFQGSYDFCDFKKQPTLFKLKFIKN